MNEGRSAAGLAFALVGLAAAAAGVCAGWYLHGIGPPPAGAPAPAYVQVDAVTREDLDSARREILAELERLGRQHSASATPGSAAGANRVSNTDANTVMELGQRLDELDARVALLSSGSRTGFGGRAWANMRGRGSGSIDKIAERFQTANALARKKQPQEDVDEVLRREHHLWMIEDVVRSYGPPEHIETSNGLALYYGRFQLEGEEQPSFVYFRIVEGFVAEVGFDCRNGW